MNEQGSENETQKEKNQTQNTELSVSKVALGSKKLGFYFNLIKFPVVFAVVVGIIYFIAQNAFDLVWVVDLLALGYVAIAIIKGHRGRFQEIIIACGMTGLAIGFFTALFKFIYFRKFYLFFNLFSEPVITALAGILVGLVIGYIFLNILPLNKKNNSSDDSFKKGGE